MKNLRNYGLRSLAVFRIIAVFIFVLSMLFITEARAQEETCTTLDDFNIPPIQIMLTGSNMGPVNLINDGSPGVLGSLRDITYGPLMPPGPTLVVVTFQAGGGSFDLDNTLSRFAPISILYNAGGAGLNVDLSNAEFIRFQEVVVDMMGATITITLIDSANNTASAAFPAPPGTTATLEIPITDFVGVVDLSDIQAIRLDIEFSMPTVDIAIGGIEICGFPGVTPSRIPTNVPTLSEWGLIAMAGILGIVGFIVMRRRKAAA